MGGRVNAAGPETANVKQEIAKRGKPREKQKIESLLAGVEPAIVQSLGTPDGAKIVLRHYLNAIRYTPKLLDCSVESLAGACLLSAQLRLEPGPLGHVYFVPFGGECVWVLGYTGIAELAHRSGRVGDLVSDIVWDCDDYRPPVRANGRLTYRHEPGPVAQRKERLGVFGRQVVPARARRAGVPHRTGEACERGRKAKVRAVGDRRGCDVAQDRNPRRAPVAATDRRRLAWVRERQRHRR
jgi:hypothetical protein